MSGSFFLCKIIKQINFFSSLNYREILSKEREFGGGGGGGEELQENKGQNIKQKPKIQNIT